MSVYLNDWSGGGFFALVANFSDVYMTLEEYEAEVPPYANVPYWLEKKEQMRNALASKDWEGIEILLASYSAANYSGEAFVLFRKDGKLYEVNASHCSCYGVEGQWEPEETNVAALRVRLDAGNLGSDSYAKNIFADDLRRVLDELEAAA